MHDRRPHPFLAARPRRQPRALAVDGADLARPRAGATPARCSTPAASTAIVVVQAAETLAETLFTLGLAERHPVDRRRGRLGRPALAVARRGTGGACADRRLKGVRPVRDDNRSIAWMLDARLEPCWPPSRERGPRPRLPGAEPGRGAARHALRRAPSRAARSSSTIAASPTSPAAASSPGPTTSPRWRQSPNVACKLSGLLNCAARAPAPRCSGPMPPHVLDRFGPDRVLWASDWPPLELAAD